MVGWHATYRPIETPGAQPATRSREPSEMTAAVLNAVSSFSLAGFFSRFASEFGAFFEEQGRALHRAHRDYPFGL